MGFFKEKKDQNNKKKIPFWKRLFGKKEEDEEDIDPIVRDILGKTDYVDYMQANGDEIAKKKKAEPSKDKKEKRKFPRQKVNLPLRFEFDGQIFSGTALDLSSNGMLLKTEARIKIGTIIHLKMQKKDRIMVVIGKVVRAEKTKEGKINYGIQFLEKKEG